MKNIKKYLHIDKNGEREKDRKKGSGKEGKRVKEK